MRSVASYVWSVVLLAIVSPLASEARGETLLPPDRSLADVVNHYIDGPLLKAKVTIAPQIADTVLVRRLTLDLIGRIPTPGEVQAYLASTDKDKRAQLVRRLIDSSEFKQHQINEFDFLLMADGKGGLRDYLTKAFDKGRTWDQMFRDLVSGDFSDPEQKQAQEFLKLRAKDLDRLTNDVSSIFFGVNISCAQCHDHPLVDDWKQDHFYGLKSFFQRTYENGGYIGERDYGLVSYLTPKGEQRQGKLMFLSGDVIAEPEAKEPDNKAKKEEQDLLKKLADKKEPPPAPKFSRRAKLVEVTLQSEGRDMFARAFVNRVIQRLFGYGLVMPADQMHSANPPSHPELLDWLARDTIAHQFDLSRLVEGLVNSQAYSRSSRWEKGDVPHPSSFAVGQTRPLSPYPFAYSLRVATTDPQAFATSNKPEDVAKKLNGLLGSSRGLAGLFPQPDDNFQVSVSETLMFSNGDMVEKDLLSDAGDRLLGRLKQITDPKQQIEMAVWSVLCRAPDAEETAAMLKYLQARSDRKPDALEQIVWALLTSAEFRFNY